MLDISKTMRSYFFIRYLIPVILMVGWVVYQMAIKNKSWDEVQDAALTSAVFVLVWIGIAYLLVD